ncbi:uncharacterized protein EDB93DRAFT_1254920 [Suillus bovinus]|uniref:uncharacterized protein n=1 Tax=Suillus bovinus TaxID=48563 RepID=UPI001B87C394|nr:uncharacterized protein EDB93DRAFT_1254920 [Suillus bovinus]KAG2133245.1 hypothetical protein EDB93DRAFT_1254920 [Suillus bovinus]
MPPAKRMKTATVREEKLPPDATTGIGLLTTIRHETISLDLPASCSDNNTWHGVFLPTIAHAAGGENIDPWFIDDNSLITILLKAWRVVYAGKPSLKHCIDAVFHASKRALYRWRAGFGSAAMMMTTNVMSSNPAAFLTYEQRSAFAKYYLYKNRFLFKNDSSNDKKFGKAGLPVEWTGMWQSPSILQIFAAHLDYTRGRVSVEALGSEEQLSRVALALSAAAVKRTLRLLSTGEMSFEVTTAVAKGKKKVIRKSETQASNSDLWKVMISNNEDFSESLWGYDSRMFLTAINRIPAENMLEIEKSAEPFMATATDHTEINSVDDIDIDAEYVDLLNFR